jgi:hypothetical protein
MQFPDNMISRALSFSNVTIFIAYETKKYRITERNIFKKNMSPHLADILSRHNTSQNKTDILPLVARIVELETFLAAIALHNWIKLFNETSKGVCQ